MGERGEGRAMGRDRGGREPAAWPCPVCGAEGSVFLLGQRYDDLPWGRRLLAVFRRPEVARVYHCAACAEVVVVRD